MEKCSHIFFVQQKNISNLLILAHFGRRQPQPSNSFQSFPNKNFKKQTGILRVKELELNLKYYFLFSTLIKLPKHVSIIGNKN